jgi:plastocyanin
MTTFFASRVAVTLMAAVVSMALGLPITAARAEGMEVRIDNFTFAPRSITVKPGTTVIWVNADDIPHIVASSRRLFKSKTLDTEDRFSFTFTTPGTYEYFCSLHPHMTGAIVVEAATTSTVAQ